ncbi:MAG TPA: hypothetical protein VN109_09055 [Devosia sp.]|jgi:hypothetical protein|nr:hypothetical protein [Devosia sp.]
MKKLSFLALAAVLGATGFAAAPAFAAPSVASNGLFCDSSATKADQEFQNSSQQLLASRRFVGKTVLSVDDWNNCIKVTYEGNHGGITTAFYDPDSFKLLQSSTSAG